MGSKLVDVDLNFNAVGKLIRALHNPVASDPGTPANGEIWLNTTSNTFKYRANGVTQTIATLNDVSAGGISASLYDAFTVLTADTDNTPVATTLGASTVLGRRSTGGIVAVTFANLKTDLEALNINAATLGGQTLAQVLARSAHTGTQTASTISDFSTAVDARIALVVDAAPATLDTLNELAAALGDDPNFATTMTNALAAKPDKYSANFGNGSLQSFTINHNLGSTDCIAVVRVVATNAEVDCQITYTDANNLTIVTNSVPTTNQYRVTVIG